MKVHSVLTGFLAILCLAIAVYAAYIMSNLRFWGHYPIFLLMGGWAGILLLVMSLRVPNTNTLNLLILSTASGLILAKGFVYTSPLLFIGFVPLLILQDKLDSGDKPANCSTHWWYAFNAFMFWNIGATWWVANAALIPAIVAFVLNSFFMTIPWMGMIQFGRSFPKLKYLSFIAFWICFEWIHQAWEISWPWLTLGNGLAFWPKLIQWYDITGTFGGTLWILIANILIASLIISKQYNPVRIGIIVLVLAVPTSYGLYKYQHIILKGNPVEVGIVQPNYEPHYEKFRIDPTMQMIKFENLSRVACTPNTRYLIWPETSFDYIRTDELNADWRIKRMREITYGFQNLCLVSGTTTIKPFSATEPHTDATRKNKEGRDPLYYEYQNSAVQVNATDTTVPVYVKSKLVPGVETFPYRHLLPFLKPIVEMFDGSSVYGLGRQKERSIFQHGKNKIAPVICYESIYGNYIGDYIRKGAQAIFIMTNDGWWDDTPGYKQHLAFGILRAIEFRRSIARSANTGISCYVDAKGDISQATDYGKDAAITKNILFSDETTTYLLTGDLIAYACIYLTLAFIAMGIFIFLKARFSKNH
jgi:apolipoprotein N-acyltransferase